MEYYLPVYFNDNFVMSCDKIRLKFVFTDDIVKQFNQFVDDLSFNDMRYIYQYFQSFSVFSYKHLLTFKHENSVVSIGLGFNGVKNSDMHNCFIEFNPNKSMVNGYVQPLIDFIKQNAIDLDIARFDCAIDLPYKKDFVYLLKDKRHYSMVYKVEQSSNNLGGITEYLGQRNNNGFVKVYNKTVESSLDYDLTRVELTLDSFDYDNFVKCLPNVCYFNTIDLVALSSLSQTDKVLISLLAHCDCPLTYFKMLGRDKKDKFFSILFSSINLSISRELFFRFSCLVRSIYS